VAIDGCTGRVDDRPLPSIQYCIVGTSGSGKTSFGRRLTEILHQPFIELDQRYWRPDWQGPGDDEFFERLGRSLARQAWVLNGNYDRSRRTKWTSVVPGRSINRSRGGLELWSGTGNAETRRNTLLKLRFDPALDD